MNLPSVGFEPIESTLLPPDPSTLPRPQRRLAQVLSKGSLTPPEAAKKSWRLRFFLSPTAFLPSPDHPDQISQISVEKTSIQGPDPFAPSAKVAFTGETLTLPASVAFRSIGYKSVLLPGLAELGVPFDAKLGIIPNDAHGRILNPNAGPGTLSAAHVPGLYVAGWSKRGPTGVIASTMDDAFATAEVVAQDWRAKAKFLNADEGGSTGRGWQGVRDEAERRGLRRVSWADWERIDRAERERGKSRGKEREKFTCVKEMLEVLD